MNVVQRQTGDHRVVARQRVEEASLPERHAILKAREPPPRLLEHVGVDIENRDPDARQAIQDSRRQGARATTEVEDMPISRRERREHLHAGGDHLFVVRDEPPDLDVVVVRRHMEVPLDGMRPTSGHSGQPIAGSEAGDGDRTRTKSLEGSCAAITPRPRAT